jgi:hypothetical protein
LQAELNIERKERLLAFFFSEGFTFWVKVKFSFHESEVCGQVASEVFDLWSKVAERIKVRRGA